MTPNRKNSPASHAASPSVASTLMDAQLNFMMAMNKCALTWLTMPMAVAEAVYSPADIYPNPTELEKRPAESSIKRSVTFPQSASLSTTNSWLAAPMIDGIEETFNDQLFQPRPRETPQRDVLTLWERSNEFGSNSAATSQRHAA